MLDRQTRQNEALDRAENGQSQRNYAAIMEGFTARGIAESEILPRENVFSYAAWQAKGRQVMKGEHGVRIVTFVAMTKRDDKSGERSSFRRPRPVSVFHISQTVELAARESFDRRAADRIDGYDRDDLGESPDF